MINIQTLSNQLGIEIADPATKGRFEIHTPTAVSPTQVETAELSFPVEKAVEVRTSTVTLPKNRGLFVRTSGGEFVFESAEKDRKHLPDDEYILEMGGVSVKLYISISSSITVRRRSNGINLGLDGQRNVVIGARSQHQTAPGTITVTDDAEDVMRALSFFGSSLKTTSPERAFSTLRGSPPLIQHGDEFHVPSNIERPSTGVKLVLPRNASSSIRQPHWPTISGQR
ncbi:hypothetical protein ACFFQF_08655 [Haladaptatus pallidirubidus]|uniref:hypothetical protein n=1 Tax=Haladaptatus pallidirubidus TaxID=1008152 RepID=UPI0035E5B352